jgi:hypothetical protein
MKKCYLFQFALFLLWVPEANCQSATDILRALDYQLASRSSVQSVVRAEVEHYTDAETFGLKDAPQRKFTGDYTVNISSLRRWSIAVDSGKRITTWLADGSGTTIKIENPLGDTGSGTILIRPYTDDVFRSVLNGDCLVLSLMSLRSSIDTAAVERDNDQIKVTGSNKDFPGTFEFGINMKNLHPIYYRTRSGGELTEEVTFDGKSWAKTIYANGVVFQKQKWTLLSSQRIDNGSAPQYFDRPIIPKYTIFCSLPHFKLDGVPSENFDGITLKDLIAVKSRTNESKK